MDETRRRALRGVGTAGTVVLAGCLSLGDDGRREDSGGGDVRVREVTAMPAVVALNTPDSFGVFGERDEQLVVAELEVESPAEHPVSSLGVEAGGEAYGATTDVNHRGVGLAGFGEPYEGAPEAAGTERATDNQGATSSNRKATDDREATSRGWIAASLPKPVDTDRATLTWDSGEHEFSQSVLEA